MGSDTSEVGIAGLFMLAATGASMFLGFVFRLVSANLLPKSMFGQLMYAVSLLSIISILSLGGLHQGLVKYLADENYSNSTKNIQINISIAITIILSIFSLSIVYIFMIKTSFIDRNIAVFILLLTMPFFSVNYIIAFSLRGLKHTKRFILFRKLSEPILKLLFVTIGIVFVGGIQGAASGFSFSVVVVTIIGLVFLYRSNWRPSFGWHGSVKSLIVFSFPLTLSYSMYMLLSHLDKILLGFFSTSTVVGEYEAALTLALLLESFHAAFSFYLFPKVSELQSNNNTEQISSLFVTTTKWILTSTTPAFLIIAAKPELILSVFNPLYITPNVTMTLQLLAIGVFLHAILGPNGEALLGFGRSRVVVISNVAAVAANLVLNIVLIPRFGPIGAAVSLIIGYICMNSIKSGELWRTHQIIPIKFGTFWRVGLYSVLLFPLLSQISLSESRVINMLTFFLVYVGLLGLLLAFYYLTNNLSESDEELIRNSLLVFK